MDNIEQLSFVSHYITEFTKYIHFLVGGNEFAAGALIAGASGWGLYLLKFVPSNVFNFFKKHTTTTMTIHNDNDSYYKMINFFKKNGILKNSRYVKIHNGRYGEEDTSTLDIGYGKQLFFLNWYTPIYINIEMSESSASSKFKEILTITKLGRSHNVFIEILKTINAKNPLEEKTDFYRFNAYKEFINSQPKRTFESIVLPISEKQKLLNSLDAFIENEAWYIEHQVPYQLGILLYGIPGSGKTTVCKAIAQYLNRDVVAVSTVEDLVNAANTVSDSIIVVEEIDTFGLADRDNKYNVSETINNAQKAKLGSVLGSLDGLISNHGRVIVMTTNHIEELDSALLRPGRIDVKIEFSNVTLETFNKHMLRFFPDFQCKEYDVLDNISPVILQNDVLLGLSKEAIIEKYTK